MVGFKLFFGKVEQIANSKNELASELCYTGKNLERKNLALMFVDILPLFFL